MVWQDWATVYTTLAAVVVTVAVLALASRAGDSTQGQKQVDSGDISRPVTSTGTFAQPRAKWGYEVWIRGADRDSDRWVGRFQTYAQANVVQRAEAIKLRASQGFSSCVFVRKTEKGPGWRR